MFQFLATRLLIVNVSVRLHTLNDVITGHVTASLSTPTLVSLSLCCCNISATYKNLYSLQLKCRRRTSAEKAIYLAAKRWVTEGVPISSGDGLGGLCPSLKIFLFLG